MLWNDLRMEIQPTCCPIISTPVSSAGMSDSDESDKYAVYGLVKNFL